MPPLPSARFVIDPCVADRIIRHIRRNEKALLAKELSQLEINAQNPLIQGDWFMAACHKNGVGVSEILVKAGVRSGNDASLGKAIERGLWNVVRAQLPSIEFISPLSDRWPSEHVLVKAAAAGQSDLVDLLLRKPMLPARDLNAPAMSMAARATCALQFLSTSRREHLGHQVVPCLIRAGANLSATVDNPDNWMKTTLFASALSNGHFELARVLVAAGADPHQQSRPETGPVAMFVAWLQRIMPRYNRQARLPPQAWTGLELLQGWGLALPELEDMDNYFRFKANTPLFLCREDGARLQAMALHYKLEQATLPAPARGKGGPRL